MRDIVEGEMLLAPSRTITSLRMGLGVLGFSGVVTGLRSGGGVVVGGGVMMAGEVLVGA